MEFGQNVFGGAPMINRTNHCAQSAGVCISHSGAHLCIHKSPVSQSLVINFIDYKLKPSTDNIISFQCSEDSVSHSLTPFFRIFSII
jgi:hypothetical protein